ncbi:MAG: ATP-binding protein [Streptosporangiales bacterium]|nr:ATP-binding protein [Streptosporangiales bacterium]
MTGSPRTWRNTTHDWTRELDAGHLAQIRAAPASYAPGGVVHLVLEVLAYAADEAAATGSGRAVVRLHADGSVAVTDHGRGTDTRTDDQGRTVKKPVLATKDLRFFDRADPVLLPDGRPRRGLSVVAALSTWLVHTNRHADGAWTQRYEHGLPVTDLAAVDGGEPTGTTVHFLPDTSLVASGVSVPPLRRLVASFHPPLAVQIEE